MRLNLLAAVWLTILCCNACSGKGQQDMVVPNSLPFPADPPNDFSLKVNWQPPYDFDGLPDWQRQAPYTFRVWILPEWLYSAYGQDALWQYTYAEKFEIDFKDGTGWHDVTDGHVAFYEAVTSEVAAGLGLYYKDHLDLLPLYTLQDVGVYNPRVKVTWKNGKSDFNLVSPDTGRGGPSIEIIPPL